MCVGSTDYFLCMTLLYSINHYLFNQTIPYEILFPPVDNHRLTFHHCGPGATLLWIQHSSSMFIIIIECLLSYNEVITIGYLQCQGILELLSANIMKWFRVPLNPINCCVLYLLHWDDKKPNSRNQTNNSQVFNIILAVRNTNRNGSTV